MSLLIIRHIIKGSRKRFVGVMLFALFGGIVELIGVTTIFPFLSLLSHPELVTTQPLLNRAFQWGGFTDVRVFIFWIGVAAIGAFIFANVYVFFKNALVTRFAIGHMGTLASRLLRHYMRNPYPFFLANHSAKIAKDVLVQSDMVANTVLQSWMTALSESFTLAALTLLVLWVDLKTGLGIVFGLGAVVATAYFLIRRKVSDLGQASDEANSQRFAYCLETLGAVKEIKATETEEFFCRAFEPHARAMAAAYTRTNVLQTLPTYFVQAITASFIIGLGLFHIQRGMDLSKIVPLLSLYVVAGYRLLPSLMKFAGAISQMRQHRAIFNNVALRLAESDGISAAPPAPRPVNFGSGIELFDVTFRYPGQADAVFDHFNLRIARNEFLALVGGSGAGKSTLVDMILGLQKPEGGTIKIGGEALDETVLPHWRRIVSYVPQSIFLMDGTIADNIAFGVWAEHVDMERVRAAARGARLDSLIESLPDGYHASVGERGAKLSGGQRQRLGLARALYRNPEVLILDESTSALDGILESEIVSLLEDLRGKVTVIVIAHRHSTVRYCDRILVMDKGRIVDSGRYDELQSRNPHFARLMSDPATR